VGLADFSLRGGVGVGAGGAVEGKLAAVGYDEGLILFGHGYTLSQVHDVRFGLGEA
jgi:hypothetical protein